MKCLELEDENGFRCVPISRINAVSIEHLGVINGKEVWMVCVAYAEGGKWRKCYTDSESATKRYNRLTEVLRNF